MKILRLGATAVGTALLLAGYLFFFESEHWRFTVACFTRAPSIAACVREDFDFTTDFFGMRFEGNMVNLIDRNVFYYGAFEKPNLFLLRDLMHAVAGETGTFIDIGANTGHHSLFMSRYSKVVHAFEPWAPVLKKFNRMVEINGIKNIAIHPYGLGEENSSKPFFRPPEKNLGAGSFVDGFNVANTREGTLEIAKGDDAFAKEKIDVVSIIKMDIEGYEKPALGGLRLTLSKHRPIVLFEMTVAPESAISIKGFKELRSLFPDQYEFLVVSKRSDLATGDYVLEPLEGIVRFDHAEQYDLLAYPSERKNSIPPMERNRGK
jgi:FkbM family methyltransferase